MEGHTSYRVTVNMPGAKLGDEVLVRDDAEWAKPLIAAGFLYPVGQPYPGPQEPAGADATPEAVESTAEGSEGVLGPQGDAGAGVQAEP